MTTESEPELTDTQKAYNVAQHEIFQLAAYGHHRYHPLVEALTNAGKAQQRDYNDRIRKAREELEAAVLRLVAEHAETFRGDWGVPAAWLRSLADDPAELSLLAVRPDERETDAMPAAPVAAPPTGQTGLRDRIAEALIAWTYRGKDPEHGGILETVRANAYSRADAVLAVLPAPVDQADDADRRAYAWAQTVDTDDGDVCIPGVHSSGTGLEAVAIVVHREDIPVLAAMLAEPGKEA